MNTTFDQLPLNKELLKAIKDAGYTTPTAIQQASIPVVLSGSDLCACAQTGSGKTASFLLPALQKLSQERSKKPGKGPRVVIISPTRELAQQIENNVKIYGKYLKWLRFASFVGGTSYYNQNRALSKPLDILIATPGRLIDHIKQGNVDFNRLEMLVLDEADRMLDMGFIDDIKMITANMPKERQTLLFSATLEGVVGSLIKSLMRSDDLQRIDIEKTAEQQAKITESLYYCNDLRHKMQLLDYLLRDVTIQQCIIFTSTKVMSEELSEKLYHQGYPSACLHGDMLQNKRNRILNQLHSGRIKILVATDVAARGIDVAGITHVINFDLPKQSEDYVHRIGRTGRAGREGIAISFAETREVIKIHKLERYLKRKLDEQEIEGLEPTRKKSTRKPPRKHNSQHYKKSGSSPDRKKRYGSGKDNSYGKKSSAPKRRKYTRKP